MALIINLISGATVWIGIILGLFLGSNEHAGGLIFAIAAGVFLYVGLGGLFPEMGEVSQELIKEGESPWLTLILEVLGLCTGLVLMILLCVYSDDIEKVFLS